MTSLPANRLPAEDATLAQRAEADAAIESVRSFLDHPAMVQNLGLAVLSRMALDEKLPPREKRRAGEVLAQLKLRASQLLAALTGTREQRLKTLGLDAAPSEVNVTQVNQRIEIVRDGSADWRTAEQGS